MCCSAAMLELRSLSYKSIFYSHIYIQIGITITLFDIKLNVFLQCCITEFLHFKIHLFAIFICRIDSKQKKKHVFAFNWF